MALILASQSPRRQRLLKRITEDFLIMPSGFDESKIIEKEPMHLVQILSRRKAEAVTAGAEHLVIGCDTVVVFQNQIFGKPKNKEEAVLMLSRLSGNSHSVFTGVCILWGEKREEFVKETKVTFYPLAKSELLSYVENENPYDKAGGYDIQGKAALFVREIQGDYYNVVGMPLADIYHRLISMGYLTGTKLLQETE